MLVKWRELPQWYQVIPEKTLITYCWSGEMENDSLKTFATQQDSEIIFNQHGTWEGDSKVAWRKLQVPIPKFLEEW